MKARAADPLLTLLLGGLALSMEAGLRIAAAAQAQVLDFSAGSQQFLGPRVLPTRDEPGVATAD